jgi:proline iminopeptidase
MSATFLPMRYATSRLVVAVAFVAATLLGACARPAPAPVTDAREGMLPVPGGRVWYRVVGASAGGTPIIGIHGGPGGTSCRLRELERLADERPVIRYDQLGSGRSERPADTTLWTLPRFVAEIDSIRARLGLREVILSGYSWGGTVALEYALTHPDHGVKALVLGSPLVGTARWMADADTLVMALPAAQRRAIAVADSTGRYDAPEFKVANDTFVARHISRPSAASARLPECDAIKGNDTIYRYMWGPSEFRATGTLRDYDRTTRLGELQLPVLFIAGEHDEARPSTMHELARLVPGAEVVIVPGVGHRLLADAPEATTRAIREFLARKGVR